MILVYFFTNSWYNVLVSKGKPRRRHLDGRVDEEREAVPGRSLLW